MRQRGGGQFPGLLVQFDVSEPGGAVDADEKIQFAFCGLNLSNINVEVAQRIGLERLLGGRVALDLGEARDVVALQAAVQRRARQVRDRGLQGIEAFFATNDSPDRLLYARTPAAGACACGMRR